MNIYINIYIEREIYKNKQFIIRHTSKFYHNWETTENQED